MLCLAVTWAISLLCHLPVVLLFWYHGAASTDTHWFPKLCELARVSRGYLALIVAGIATWILAENFMWKYGIRLCNLRKRGWKQRMPDPKLCYWMLPWTWERCIKTSGIQNCHQWMPDRCYKNGELAACFHLNLNNIVCHELACLLPRDCKGGARQEQTRARAQLHSSSHLTWRCPGKNTILSILPLWNKKQEQKQTTSFYLPVDPKGGLAELLWSSLKMLSQIL